MKKAALQVNNPVREVPPGVSADTPLVTLAWRAARAEHQRRSEVMRGIEGEIKKLQDVLIGVADQTTRLRQAAAGQKHFEQIAEALEAALGQASIAILAPVGETFAGELMDLFDSIAQRPEVNLKEPYVAEVVKPAVLRNGALLRMGKAVIAVPAVGDSALGE